MGGNEEAEDRRMVVLAESQASCILEACWRYSGALLRATTVQFGPPFSGFRNVFFGN